MFLGIEIGGTKLQLGVGDGQGPHLTAVTRHEVDPARGAAGILERIESAASALLQKHPIARIGVGFGGPVDAALGVVTKSHQIDGWENFPLGACLREVLGRPVVLGNDCDVAALAEARYGAGRECRSVFYVTVGTGVGGGLVIDGKLHGAGRPAVAEIGHLRPGLHDDRPEMTVESHASGWGIAAAAVARIAGDVSHRMEVLRTGVTPARREQIQQRLAFVADTEREYIADLLQRCGGDPEALTTRMIGQAAAEGNEIARVTLAHGTQVLGWAIAQMITLLAPHAVVVGGGVSLLGEQQFFAPLREQTERYLFPPLLGSYRILPAELGELVVVHGAIALASA